MNRSRGRSENTSFEERLQSRREELRQSVRASLDAMGENELAREVGDIEDHALASWMDTLREASLQRDVDELNDIDAALTRIGNGSYGVCMDCGEDIPRARLHAFPTAKRCLSCQEIYDQRAR